MKVVKDLLAAFSLYSRIPMPPVRFEKGEGRGAILFLPLVGAVIGGVIYGALQLNRLLDLPVFVLTILLSVIPLALTGGFHLDGFLDVEDALSSFQDRQKRLEILKDPHIGAFGVIRFSLFGLLWMGALYLLIYCAGRSGEASGLYQYALLFAATRGFCGLSCLLQKKARESGMLNFETKEAGPGGFIFLALETGISGLLLVLVSPLSGVLILAGIAVFTLYYVRLTKKSFGGVTGDTAGFYVAGCELTGLMILAGYSLWLVS